MDHVVYLDAKAQELDNLLAGNKSMIIRGAAGKKIPYGKVFKGDVLYFINSRGETKVKARGIVTSVISSDQLSVEESFETIIRNQDKLQLPDKQFERLAGKRCLVLVELSDIEKVEPFRIDTKNFRSMDNWIPVGKIETVCFEGANIG